MLSKSSIWTVSRSIIGEMAIFMLPITKNVTIPLL